MSRISQFVAMGLATSLAGCGLTVPDMEDFYQHDQIVPHDSERLDENVIVNQVKCELTRSVYQLLVSPPLKKPGGKAFVDDGHGHDISTRWLKNWGAKIQMTLTVDEKGGLAPGLTYNSPFEKAGQTFSLGLGASASADATRQETITFTYAFDDLLRPHLPKDPSADPNPAFAPRPCDNEGGVLIHSDLKIGDFIASKVFLAMVPGTIIPGTIDPDEAPGLFNTPCSKDVTAPPGAGGGSGAGPVQASTVCSPYSTFTYKVTFLVAYSANATPSWKLVRFTANPGSPFLSAMRTKTQDIQITMSPVTHGQDKNSPAQLNADGEAAFNAGITGQAVAGAIANQIH